MNNFSSFFTSGAKGILKFLKKPSLSYKGNWIQVFPDTVLDSWHVGDFSTASYLITVEHQSNKKELMHVNVVARPDQASYNIFGRTSIDDELIILDASVTNSIFSLKVSPSDPLFTGAKITMLVFYGETINALTPAVPITIGPGFEAGTSGNTEGGGTGSSYILPTASTVTLGGVKVDGSSISIINGVISATAATGLTSRSNVVATTASLVNGATENVSVTGYKGYLLYKIQTSAAAWVRIYTDTASQSADSARDELTDPDPGSGVIAEVITTGPQTVLISPGTVGFSNESTPSSNIKLTVTNKSGSTSVITVTLTVLQLET